MSRSPEAIGRWLDEQPVPVRRTRTIRGQRAQLAAGRLRRGPGRGCGPSGPRSGGCWPPPGTTARPRATSRCPRSTPPSGRPATGTWRTAGTCLLPRGTGPCSGPGQDSGVRHRDQAPAGRLRRGRHVDQLPGAVPELLRLPDGLRRAAAPRRPRGPARGLPDAAGGRPGLLRPRVHLRGVRLHLAGRGEDEEGKPGGIGEVCAQIARYKEHGFWDSDRLLCYRDLARTFSHLYFPPFTAFSYRYEERTACPSR